MPWHIVFSEDLCPFPSISRLQQIYQELRIYLYSNILHSQAKCSEVSTAWNIPCSSEGRVTLLSVTKGGGSGVFFVKTQGRTNTFFGR